METIEKKTTPNDYLATGFTVKQKGKKTPMTVNKVDSAIIECVWFENDNLQTKSFPASELEFISR